MFGDLCETLGIGAEELRRRSRGLLLEILHNYAFFDVSTIDKFNHRILRTFGKDLQLPAGFEVITDTDHLLRRAVDALVQRAGADRRLTEVLLEFALEKAEEDRHWDVSLDLMDMGKLLFRENDLPYLEMFRGKSIEDFLELRQLLEGQIQECDNILKMQARQMLDLIREHSLEPADFNSGCFPKFLLRILDGQTGISSKAAWQKDFGEKPLWIAKTPDDKKAIIDGLMPSFVEGFTEIRRTYYEKSFLENARKNSAPFTVLGLLRLELERLQQEESLLPVAHFNAIIAGELAAQPAAYIYERLGEKYRYYFIDEFQDTSLLQWQNLIPLISNALSGEDENQERGGLILVGDAKQAIYRWRGGRAEQFMGLSNKTIQPFPVTAQIEPLPRNFRSHKTLVDFNNELFSHLGSFLSRATYSLLFTETSRQQSRSREEGFIRLEFLASENEPLEQAYVRRTIETLQELKAAGYPWRDICILTRRRKEGIAISEALAEAGIPVVSSETLLLQNHPAVRFLIGLLNHLRDPSDLNPVLEMLYYLGPGPEGMHDWISGHLATFDALLRNRYGFHPEEAAYQPVYDILEYAISCFDLGGDAEAYLIFLLDTALEVGIRGDQGIGSFLEHWESKKEEVSLKAPENQNAVRLMTIHKAKGLEFPVVVYPFADSPISGFRQGKIWVPVPPEDYAGFPFVQIGMRREVLHYGEDAARVYLEEQENNELDALNILYVAHTRAEKALIVLSSLPSGPSEEPSTYGELYQRHLQLRGLWDPDTPRYEFGTLPQPESGTDPPKGISLPFRHSSLRSQPVRMVTRTGQIWDTPAGEAISSGNLIHYAMSLIRTRDDLSPALSRLLREGEIRASQRESTQQVLRAITEHPDLKSYFEPGWEVYNERDLLMRKAVLLRPDRFQIRDGKAVILDYKSGIPKPEHRAQLGQYADAIRAMGYQVIRSILVYIQEKQITLEEL